MRALGFALAVVSAGVAQAAPSTAEVYLTVTVPDPKGAPVIEATVIGAPNLPAAKLSLESGGTVIGATKLRSYAQGNEPIAIVFVVNYQEVWIGNDDIEKDEPARYKGALKSLVSGFTKSKLSAFGPKGSQGALITYADTAKIRVPMGDLAKVTGAAFGSQKDAYHKVGTDLVAGVELGLAELHKVTVARRAMIILGDGNDTNNDAAKGKLAALKKQAAQDRVELFSVVYKGALSDPSNVVTTLVPGSTTVGTADGFATALTAIAGRLADRYYVTFPGYDPKTHQGFPWDGKPHDFVLHLDHDVADAVTLSLAPVWTPTK